MDERIIDLDKDDAKLPSFFESITPKILGVCIGDVVHVDPETNNKITNIEWFTTKTTYFSGADEFPLGANIFMTTKNYDSNGINYIFNITPRTEGYIIIIR